MRLTDKQTIVQNLSSHLKDVDYNRIFRYFPVVQACPTCNDKQAYWYEGQQHECDCELQKLLQKHYYAANIGRSYHNLCLEHFVGDDRDHVVPIVEEYIDKFDDNFFYGLGISFSGRERGTGKTLAMSYVLKELIKRGRQAYTISFEELVRVFGSAYKDEESNRMFEKLMSVEVLGLDEWRTDPRNREGFLADSIDVILRHRTNNALPTLITTNMTPKEEQAEFGAAYSLLSARNYRLEFTGRDVRPTAIRDRDRRAKDLGERRPIC